MEYICVAVEMLPSRMYPSRGFFSTQQVLVREKAEEMPPKIIQGLFTLTSWQGHLQTNLLGIINPLRIHCIAKLFIRNLRKKMPH